ncbi:MAG TPA: carbonic anhydrase [Methylocella sp.]|jgi:carbonic anhydrase|nr:carbonic anhydrase [Methylocella sp.]
MAGEFWLNDRQWPTIEPLLPKFAILGSMEFACKLSGAKVILVMGHTECGAIKGAIDNAELGNLTGLLAKIKPAVAVTTYTGERTSKNYAFVEAVARKNVEITIADIRKDTPMLAEMKSNDAIKMAGAMYNLETAKFEIVAVITRSHSSCRRHSLGV